eukprot:NODE_465_length_1721_cov_65.302033_g388_i0.p1 GENE.NODE_465_length_1721_cov_65.302033_g388_i0~~NODE_465_length_1721_cov_65.302033_g388_i0.p1  ORF type:complete len:242 (-),score=57.42 NODE_465_length_1721_cov_65.302033_g388_i0:248-973(-)
MQPGNPGQEGRPPNGPQVWAFLKHLLYCVDCAMLPAVRTEDNESGSGVGLKRREFLDRHSLHESLCVDIACEALANTMDGKKLLRALGSAHLYQCRDVRLFHYLRFLSEALAEDAVDRTSQAHVTKFQSNIAKRLEEAGRTGVEEDECERQSMQEALDTHHRNREQYMKEHNIPVQQNLQQRLKQTSGGSARPKPSKRKAADSTSARKTRRRACKSGVLSSDSDIEAVMNESIKRVNERSR